MPDESSSNKEEDSSAFWLSVRPFQTCSATFMAVMRGQKNLNVFKVMFEGSSAQFLWEKCVRERPALPSGTNVVLGTQPL